jgi:predicted ATP-grasp superfamily ATP-dependent carboligase
MATEEASATYCVVLGLETQIGLNVVRELGRAGIKVIGIAQTDSAIGLRSRHLWKGLVEPRARSAELLAMLKAVGHQFGPCPLLAISEANLLWMSQHRVDLQPLQAVLAPPEAFRIVLDKSATLDAARAVGLQVPASWQPLSAQDIDSRADEFPLPAVLKWSDPNRVIAALEQASLPLLKAEYVESGSELRAALSRYRELELWPIVQQYCPGYGLV